MVQLQGAETQLVAVRNERIDFRQGMRWALPWTRKPSTNTETFHGHRNLHPHLISWRGFGSAWDVWAGDGVLCLVTSASLSLVPKELMRAKKLVAR